MPKKRRKVRPTYRARYAYLYPLSSHTLLPVEVEFIEPDDDQWENILKEEQVYLTDEEVKIRVMLRNVEIDSEDIDSLNIELNSSITRAELESIELDVVSSGYSTMVHKDGNTEFRVSLNDDALRALALRHTNGVDSDPPCKAAIDNIDGSGFSNLNDSQSFLDDFPSVATTSGSKEVIYAGHAHNDTSNGDPSIYSSPPKSLAHESFMKAGGAEVLTVSGKKSLIMNQAEFFYYSGHGAPGSGYTNGPNFYGGALQGVHASALKSYWDQEMRFAIIAGCSVVDINGENGWVPFPAFNSPTIGPNAGYYPGLYMNDLGPEYIFGYGGAAPRDTQNADAIVSEFVRTFQIRMDGYMGAWANANFNPNGRNATAIHKDTTFGFFEKQELFGVTVGHTWIHTTRQKLRVQRLN